MDKRVFFFDVPTLGRESCSFVRKSAHYCPYQTFCFWFGRAFRSSLMMRNQNIALDGTLFFIFEKNSWKYEFFRPVVLKWCMDFMGVV
jgi:hypothetical protein